MPVKQQYYIATALITLIAVLVVFAIFDYRSDVQRFTSAQPAPMTGAAFTSRLPSPPGWGIDAQGFYLCPGCGWRGASLLNSRCPNCAYCVQGPGTAPPSVTTAQRAAFLWRQPQPTPAPRGILFCPACEFSMSTKYKTFPNTVKCPWCAAFLVRSTQPDNFTQGQQAAFVPGRGLGMGLNPYCPIR